ncbi:alpha/beta fold hydrolase [Plantactinospora siamensis]|uniref:Alpha/beta fold hydrolase n=1 Tax=Plantactinospora siamensis TaxID=555372 RepID=A0ABV6NST8_9ACTN
MTLSFDRAGSGPTVVLLHSGVADRRMWDPQWPVLTAAGYDVLRCDFRGYGETPVATESYDDAEDVRDLLDSVGLGRAAVVGSSFGGRVAQEFAARWPDRVTALCLLCPASRLHPPTDDIRAFNEREDELLEAGDVAGATELNVATFVGPEASAQTRKLVAEMQRHAFEAQLAAGDSAAPPRHEDFDLTAVTAPTLVVSGDRDLDYFRSTAEFLAGAIPGAEHVRLPWAGHLPSLEDPDRTNPLILNLLSRHR